MGEIKFRVWSTVMVKKGDMVYIPENFNGDDLIETDNWKVMQYTGQKDKGDWKAIKFMLSTKGKSRGYAKKQEVEIKGTVISETNKLSKGQIEELLEDIKKNG